MPIADTLRMMWMALVLPTQARLQASASTLASFALAVFILTFANTATGLWESGRPNLTRQLAVAEMPVPKASGDVDLSLPQRAFTAHLGVTLVRVVVSLLFMSALAYALTRFLTDQQFSFGIVLTAVSSTCLIDAIRIVVYAAAHVLTDSMRWGLHAGVFVDPSQHQFLFAWLHRIDLVTWWQYVVMAMVVCTSAGLHYRFGIVVGSVVFLITVILAGGFAFVGWLMQLAIT